jgi:hypothetical protein
MRNEGQVRWPTRNLVNAALQLCRDPDIILIAKGYPFAGTAQGSLNEVLAEAEADRIFPEVDGKRRILRKLANNIFGRVRRAVIADVKFGGNGRLGSKALELLLDKALAVVGSHCERDADHRSATLSV